MDVSRQILQKCISTVTKIVKSALINHDAYLQADAKSKNLNLDKFRKEIIAGLSDDTDDDDNEEKTDKKFLRQCTMIMIQYFKKLIT